MKLKIYNNSSLPDYIINDIYLINQIKQDNLELELNKSLSQVKSTEDLGTLLALTFLLKNIFINNITDEKIIYNELLNIGINDGFSSKISTFCIQNNSHIREYLKSKITLINPLPQDALEIDIFKLDNDDNNLLCINKNNYIVSNANLNKFKNNLNI